MSDKILKQDGVLLSDLCGIIDGAKHRVATTVNSGITLMYWSLGK